MNERTVDEIASELEYEGTPATDLEVLALCEAVIEGERAAMKCEALERALNKVGLVVIDITTDDDEGTTLQIVPATSDDED